MNSADPNINSSQGRKEPGRSSAEWVTFGVSVVILSTVIGLVLYVWLGQQRKPPILSVTYQNEIRTVNGQFYVPFTLTNKGGETVESVRVLAELKTNSDKEEGEQEIDFLSSGEEQEGAFIFSKNPMQGKLTLKVTSYKLP